MLRLSFLFMAALSAGWVGAITPEMAEQPGVEVLASIKGGQVSGDCRTDETTSLTACQNCQSTSGGTYIDCVAQPEKECKAFSSDSECIHCEDGEVSCPGTYKEYSDDDCETLIQDTGMSCNGRRLILTELSTCTADCSEN